MRRLIERTKDIAKDIAILAVAIFIVFHWPKVQELEVDD
jgi:hypothetical protein